MSHRLLPPTGVTNKNAKLQCIDPGVLQLGITVIAETCSEVERTV